MNEPDHYLGGVICEDTAPEPEDYEGLKIYNAVSTAFLGCGELQALTDVAPRWKTAYY